MQEAGKMGIGFSIEFDVKGMLIHDIKIAHLLQRIIPAFPG